MVSQDEVDQDWANLAEAEPVRREADMVARYTALAAISEEERRAKLRAMARAEYGLSDEKLRAFTISRMRTWLSLDREAAAIIANTYDAIMQEMPAAIAMKRVFLVQTLVKEFSAEDEERLRELAPMVFAGAPSRLTGLAQPEPALRTETKRSTKPGWAFWRKN